MSWLAGLLPYVCLLLFVAVARRRAGRWSDAVLLGAIAWGAVVVALTETLGAARAISFGSLLAVWSAMAVGLTVVVVRRGAWRVAPALRASWAAAGARRLLLLPVVLVAGVTLLIALAAPPNTFDSMAYHMSRVAHWAANRSVDHYPTAILRQLHLAPFGEYAILHSYVLAGGDRYANLAQWLAMLGSLAAVSAIARRLGGGGAGVLLAVVFCATLPIGIMEATGTKNDYVTAFWVACAAWLVLLLRDREAAAERETWLALGAAVGLAILTKATAYLYTAPLLLWLLIATVRRRPSARLVGNGALAALLALTLNAAFFARNIELNGNPIGPAAENAEHRYANERRDLQVLASNLLRNSALQLGTGSARLDALVTRAVRKAHRILGIDPALPATTWMSIEFDVHQRWRHEDSAPNPLHFLLLLAAPVALLAWRGDDTPAAFTLLAAIGGGFILFAGYLQWQPWHSRLHLPLFVLGAPVAGIALARVPWSLLPGAAAVLLMLAGLPALGWNESRPLVAARNVLNVSHSTQYFANWTDLARTHHRTAGLIRAAGCREVALVAWWNSYEYPLWALLGGPRQVRIRHVMVDNESARFAPGTGSPPPACALVALARHEAAAAYAARSGLEQVLKESGVILFLRPSNGGRRPIPGERT